jgi:hypothetical protein
MRIEQARFTAKDGWSHGTGDLRDETNLVLVFGAPDLLSQRERISEITQTYPNSIVVGCSTAGEISGIEVTDDSLVLTAIAFGHTRIRSVTLPLSSPDESTATGTRIGETLAEEDLVHILVLSEGLHVNGSKLAKGISDSVSDNTLVTGGLAGDGERFGETLILADGIARADRVTAIGFYGTRLKTGCGSLGGWDPFGPERLITCASENVLHELDGRPALEIYRKYLGPYEKDLPASALLFPLALRRSANEPAVVRTVLAIDDAARTMTFAGDMPEGSYARFMKANLDRLLDGATGAAAQSRVSLDAGAPGLALLISCVGRKMVLKQRVEEEVEGVRRVLGDAPTLTGFYSYGEISPFTPGSDCKLHNQTMTITTFYEG